MLSNIITSSVQKKFLPLWGGLLFFSLLDITTRLTNYEVKSNDKWKITSIGENTSLQLSQERANTIIQDINNYQATPEADNETSADKTMSEAEQLAQQGSLSQLYAGNIRYRLVGIFDKSERFAVIQQLDTSDNKQKLIKLSALESLQDYKITKILANKVTLNSKDGRQVSLYLYKQLNKSN